MRSRRERMAELVSAHHADLYRHALWLTGDPALAEDLVQETYYEAWRTLSRLGGPRAPRAWLLAILRRRLARHRAAPDPPTAPPEALAGLAGGDDPEAAAELEGLARAFAALPAHQREILLLRALHGLSYREIARLLDLPLGTVMSRLSRARAALLAADPGEAHAAEVVPFPRRRSPGGGKDG